MTEHPITPPPELVKQWIGEFFGCTAGGELTDSERFLTTRAAQWGADQELEACCELTRDNDGYDAALALRADRRPNTITFNTADTKEIARFTEDGFYYKGEFIDDAGEVHRLLKEVLGQMSDKKAAQ